MSLRLLSYNIKHGGRGREQALAAVIRACDADVVMLQEASDRNVVARLAELTGLPNWDARQKYSTGYLTRLDVLEHGWSQPRGSRHAFLEVALRAPSVRLFGLHLTPWFSKWTEYRRAMEIKALLHGIREHQHGFHLIAGDFNALAPDAVLQMEHVPHWIRTMIWLSGRKVARQTIQHMLDQKYLDIWREAHPDEAGYTFPSWNPHVRLDYVFTPKRYQAAIRSCQVVTSPDEAKTASDHFPLLAEIDDTIFSEVPPAR